MKRLSVITNEGVLFGMEAEDEKVDQAMRTTFMKEFHPYLEDPETTITRRSIKAADMAKAMAERADLIAAKEIKAVRMGANGPWLRVVYPS